jgi:DNA-binding CsgD family transcriptional regulator
LKATLSGMVQESNCRTSRESSLQAARTIDAYAPEPERMTPPVMACEPPNGDRRPLTERELEALRWTMEGKTAWEVGSILGISEQTAVRHLSNATRKLGCVHKHHAVVTAMRLGLLQ